MSKTGFGRSFGVIAVKKGFIKPDELINALRIQLMEYLDGKEPRRIGKILYDEGLMAIQNIDVVLQALDLPIEEID